MAFKMKYKNLQGVVDELKGAVKAHGKQANPQIGRAHV